MWYKIDFLKLSYQLLPTFLRQSRLLAFIRAIITQMQVIHSDFLALREASIRRLGNASISVIALEKLLNDQFLYYSNEIFITDADGRPVTYLFNRSEDQLSVHVYNRVEEAENTYLFNRGESTREFDFVINIPNELDTASNLYQIATTVDYYKMPGKSYKIQSYE